MVQGAGSFEEMGKKGRAVTRRKPTLQLDDSKRSDSKRSSRGLDYTHPLSQVGTSTAAVNGSEAKITTTSEEGETEGVSDGLSEGDVKSTEQMDSEIANFLKEISALGNTDSADSSTADKPGDTPIPNSDMETSQEERQEAVVPTTATQQPSDNGESGTGKEGGREGEKGSEEREITFWQEVVDPNTNHAYYWNPLTNEVAWTLPENGVISEDGQQMSTETSSTSKETTYADYYAYYAQTYYGVEPSSSTAANPEASSTAANGASQPAHKAKQQVTKSKKGTKVAKAEKKNAAKPVELVLDPSQEGFVGPTLPPGSEQSEKTVNGTNASLKSDSQHPPTSKSAVGGQRSTRGGHKRKVQDVGESPLVSSVQRMKKPRLQAGSPEGEKMGQVVASPSTPLSKQAEQALRLQVSTLADELSRKLHYLHVGGEGGVSDLQVLNIQLQTRLADWKDGGLSSKFMLSRLKQASLELQQYEESAAPPGWKCVWDRTSCRYKFHNLSTSEASWDYPLQAVLSPAGSVEPPSSELSSQEGEEATDQETTEEEEAQTREEGEKAEEEPEQGEEEEEEEDESSEEMEEEEMNEEKGDVSLEEQPQCVYMEPPIEQKRQPEVTAEQMVGGPQAAPSTHTTIPTTTMAVVGPQLPPSTHSTPPTTAKSVPDVPQQYRGPTAEYLSSQEGPPPPPSRRSRQPPPAPPEPPPEERELTVEEVRQKLHQKGRKPLSSIDEKTESLPPDDDEEEENSEGEEPVAESSEQADGLEFISEFPPHKPPSPVRADKLEPPTNERVTVEAVMEEEPTISPVKETDDTPDKAEQQDLPEEHALKEPSASVDQLPSLKAALSPAEKAKEQLPELPSAGRTPSPTEIQTPPGGEPEQTGEGGLTPLVSPPPQQLPTGEIVFSRDPRVAKRQKQLLEQMSVSESLKEEGDEDTSVQQEEEAKEDAVENEARMRERLLRRAKYRIRKKSRSPSLTEAEKQDVQLDSTSSEPTASAALETVEESTGEVEPSLGKVPISLGPSLQGPLVQTDDVFQADRVESGARVEPETGEKESVVEPSQGARVATVEVVRVGLRGKKMEVGGSGEGNGEEPGTPVQDERAEEMEQKRAEQPPSQEAAAEVEPAPSTPQLLHPPKKEEGEEGEILSASPSSPVAKPMGKCYMDLEEGEVVGEGKEESKTESRRPNRHNDSDRSDYSDNNRHKTRSSRSKRSSRSRSRDSHRRSSRRHHDDSDYSDHYYSDKEHRRRYSENEYKGSSSYGSRSSRRSRRYRDDYSDYSDEYDSYRSSRRSRRYRDSYYSDYSDDEYYGRGRDRSREKLSRKSRKESERDEGKSSRRSRKHRSRSRSKDSKDSREKDRERDGSKKRKKDKKDKEKDRKKKHHKTDKSPSKDGSGGEGAKGPLKQPPNVLVGKVGRLGSVRTLGQEKKSMEDDKTTDTEPTTTEQQQQTTEQQMQVTAPPPSMHAAFYQQSSTGQIPYYPMSVPAEPYQPYDTSSTAVYSYQSTDQGNWQQWSGEQQQWASEGQDRTQFSQGGGEVQYAERAAGEQSGYEYTVVKNTEQPQAQESQSAPQTVELNIDEEEPIAECEMEIDENSPDQEESPQVEKVTASAEEVSVTPPASGDGKPELETPVEPPSQAVTEGSAEETTQPKQEPMLEPVPEPVSEPVPEPVSEPVPDPVPEPVLKPVPEPVPEPMPEPVSKPVPEPVSKPVPEPMSKPVPEPAPEPVPEPVSKPVPEPAPEPVPEPVSKPVPEPAPEPVPEPVSKPVPEPVPEPVPDQDMEASTVAAGGHGTPPPPGTEPEVPPPQMSTHEIQSLPSSQEAASAAYAAYAGTQPTADYYQTAAMATPQAQGAYTYGAYAQTSAASQQPYDYSAYAQTGYGGYAQAYNTYLQQAAAAASYGGYSMAPSGQYYPASYQTYASYNPYGYYTSGTAAYNTSAAATAYQQQMAVQNPYSTTQPSSTTEAGKKGKKSEFALPGSKEKQVKSMMERWQNQS